MSEEKQPKSRRRRIGRIICICSSLVALIMLSGWLVVSAVAMTGVTQPITSYNQFASPVALLSIFAFVVGLVMYIIPDGMTKDGTWVMMTGPIVGNN